MNALRKIGKFFWNKYTKALLLKLKPVLKRNAGLC